MSLRPALNSTTLRCLVLFGVLMAAFSVQAKRLALVLGNDNYASVNKLQKAGNDAESMAKELKAAGFTVTLQRDLNYRSMVKVIESFTDGITGGDEVVVFYAGHGVQIKAGSYLLPVDIEAESESQVEKTAYGLNDLTEKLSEAKPAFTLVMVDACRDNPMKVKGRAVGNSRGLNALEPPKGQMVVYSASRGQQALDRLSDRDTNPNGVFTREFITRMRTPGVKIEDLMRDVQDSVESLAKTVRHEQRPAVYNEARGNFYFYGPTNVQIQQGGDDSEAQTWAAAQAANTVTAYQTYLDLFPKGRYLGPAKIKLDAIKQSAEKSFSDTEAGLWAEVKATGTREYLEAYIEQYPKGKYVVLARLELKKLDDAEKAKNVKLALEAQQAKQREEQQVQRLDQAAWDEAQKADTTSSYAAYLEKYPSGRFATQAKAAKQAVDERIAATRRAEEERLKAELAKKAEQERTMAEAKKAAEERARAAVAKKAEEDRIAAEAKRVAEERAKADAVKMAGEEQRIKAELTKKAEEDRLRAGPIKPEMVVIPAGSFMMGSKSAFLFSGDKNPEEKPQHLVKIPSFLMGKTEVTQGQWKSVMGSNPSSFNECGDNCPVENVSWNDAQNFIRKLNQLAGQNYRLPTEAEWEYVARAGTTTEWSFGNDGFQIGKYAWHSGNGASKTHGVGLKMPNAFDLYDMHGNVWEWVEDCWHGTYNDAPIDGSAWTTGCSDKSRRVLRGGSWDNHPDFLRSAYRIRSDPGSRDFSNGFRLASALPAQVSGGVIKPEASNPSAGTKKPTEIVQRGASAKKSGEMVKDCSDCPEMVVIPAGSFVMGSSQNSNEQPTHSVNLRSFLMGKTEVTQQQWETLMGRKPGTLNACGPDCPVEHVSWSEIQEFIFKLNQKTGQTYRLPSEAEWEYAARAGTDTDWSFGSDEAKLGNYAWYVENIGSKQVVGQKLPNAFGLYDMLGNVSEWTQDCWHQTYSGAPTDGSAWTTGCPDATWRVLRGGSWGSYPANLRSAYRSGGIPGSLYDYNGFRLARNP